METIIISDLHLKKSEAHLYGINKFLEWIYDNYKDCRIIQLGDLFDSSSPHADLVNISLNHMLKFKEWHIIEGNHDKSRRLGSAIRHLNYHRSIHIHHEKTEVELDGLKFLFLPYIHKAKEEYSNIEWKGDYCLAHITNMEDAFNENDGVDTSKIDAIQIFGHTHTQHIINDRKIVLGVPVPTRNLEKTNSIIKIKEDGSYELIDVPVFFEYENINFGEEPKSKHNILNISNAPSVPSVYEKYKGYHIRRRGIVLDRKKDNTLSIENDNFEKMSLKNKFLFFGKERLISEDLINIMSPYFEISE